MIELMMLGTVPTLPPLLSTFFTHHANRSRWGTSTRLNEEKFVLVDVKEFDLLLLLDDDEEELPSINEGDEVLSADKDDKVLCTK